MEAFPAVNSHPASKRWFTGRLSPVGEPIELQRSRVVRPGFVPDNFDVLLVDSGTSALSLAMSLASGFSSCARPEVIVPAYACPDLLAAAYHAGLDPVLVDIQADSPHYQLAELESALNANTAAIVAVNFLGLSENLAALRSLIAGKDISLIEDNAQYFPTASDGECYQGDLVVHSFGRGKPISQVGGGALLSSGKFTEPLSRLEANLPKERLRESQWRLKAHLFNLVLRPQIYRIISALPFLHIGETRYHSLEQIQRMDDWRLQYLESNVESYRLRSRSAQLQIDEQLLRFQEYGLINLPRQLDSLVRPLLRYPILCRNEAQCTRLYRRLLHEGLGVSRMYGRPLATIDGIPRPLAGDWPGAAQFARRLLTLPVTSYVHSEHLQRMGEVFAEILPRCAVEGRDLPNRR